MEKLDANVPICLQLIIEENSIAMSAEPVHWPDSTCVLQNVYYKVQTIMQAGNLQSQWSTKLRVQKERVWRCA